MAFRSRRSASRTTRKTGGLLDDLMGPYSQERFARSLISSLEDRRRFHPLGRNKPAAAYPRSAARLVPVSPNEKRSLAVGASSVPHRIGFEKPDRVSICAKRKTRREVILAKGKGGGRNRRPRRNEFSDVEC